MIVLTFDPNRAPRRRRQQQDDPAIDAFRRLIARQPEEAEQVKRCIDLMLLNHDIRERINRGGQ